MADSTLPTLVGGPSIGGTAELIDTGRRAHESLCRDIGDGLTFNRTLVGDLADELARAMAQIADLETEVDRRHQRERGLRALLRTGCDLLADESDALKSGVRIFSDGSLSDDPADANTVARIAEIEDWIASVGATLFGGAQKGGE